MVDRLPETRGFVLVYLLRGAGICPWISSSTSSGSSLCTVSLFMDGGLGISQKSEFLPSFFSWIRPPYKDKLLEIPLVLFATGTSGWVVDMVMHDE